MPNVMCRTCGFDGDDEYTAQEGEICGCCGYEIGYDDRGFNNIDDARNHYLVKWAREGFPWFDAEEPKPDNWDPVNQLERVGFNWKGRRESR